jgi:hypothetical protein
MPKGKAFNLIGGKKMEYKQAKEVLNQRRARGLNTVSVFTFRALTEEERKDLIVDNQLRNYSQTPKLTPEEKAHNKEVRERFGMVPGCRYAAVNNKRLVGFFQSEWHAVECAKTLEDLVVWSDKRLMYVSFDDGKECPGSEILKTNKWHREKDAILIDWD